MENYAMNRNENANGTLTHASYRPTVVVGAGQLTGVIWGTGRRCRISLARVDRESGVVDQQLTPANIVDLANLTALLADSLNRHGNLEGDLGDDLGFLSHCIAQAMGMRWPLS
jgi:hypothetical protein